MSTSSRGKGIHKIKYCIVCNLISLSLLFKPPSRCHAPLGGDRPQDTALRCFLPLHGRVCHLRDRAVPPGRDPRSCAARVRVEKHQRPERNPRGRHHHLAGMGRLYWPCFYHVCVKDRRRSRRGRVPIQRPCCDCGANSHGAIVRKHRTISESTGKHSAHILRSSVAA